MADESELTQHAIRDATIGATAATANAANAAVFRNNNTNNQLNNDGGGGATVTTQPYSELNEEKINSQLGDPGVCSCLVCCFGCLTCFGCRDWVCRGMVFFPPPPQYVVRVELKETGGNSAVRQHVMYIRDAFGTLSDPYWSDNFRIYMIKTRKKQTVCSYFISAKDAKKTVLVSHGNATDIGLLRNHLLEFSSTLGVNVYAYDYTGYGMSSNPFKPSVSDTIADIEAAYEHLTETLRIPPTSIILYGQSLGTGPTLHLAQSKPVRGVVVHSGIMSGLRVIRPLLDYTYWFDIFPNVDIINKCKAPVFVIHGTCDEEINIRHGRKLYSLSKNKVEPWWVEGGGHNDIEFETRSEYFRKLRDFFKSLDEPMDLTISPGGVDTDSVGEEKQRMIP
mmetsp:Transcript_3583/g.6684  ORF Transcript_3583/g.6684 Transcript_3583/m.6684 type:complete len:393 (-) Transcript_3583:61-1239(-)